MKQKVVTLIFLPSSFPLSISHAHKHAHSCTVDILVYLLLCFQLPYIYPSISDHHDETDSPQCTIFNPDKVFSYIKILIFQYGFWLTLLLIFLIATLQISLFGCLYIGACFGFVLYRHGIVEHKHWIVWYETTPPHLSSPDTHIPFYLCT